MDWKSGIDDAELVLKDWIKQYQLFYKQANDKHNKMGFYMCIKALENVIESLKKLDPPEEKQ
jgi:hypothetical protein